MRGMQTTPILGTALVGLGAFGRRDGRVPQFMVVIWDGKNYGRLWQ